MRVCLVVLLSDSGTLVYGAKLARYTLKEAGLIEISLVGNSDACSRLSKHALGELKERVVKCWRRNGLLLPLRLAACVRRLKCDLAHVQFEYSTFGSPFFSHQALLLSTAIMRALGARVVVTLHGVLLPRHVRGKTPLPEPLVRKALPLYYRLLAMSVDAIVVLNDFQRRILASYGVPAEKLRVIPHGAEVGRAGSSKPSARRREQAVVLFHGFIRPSKGLHHLIDAIDMLTGKGYNIKLKILGSLPYQWRERREEREYLRRLIARLRKMGRCVELVLFPSEERVLEEVSACDVIVLPYTDNYIESSGVLHLLMACGKPLVLSSTPRFLADVSPRDGCIMVRPNASEIARALEGLLNSGRVKRRQGTLHSKALGRRWEVVARKHIKLYGEVLLKNTLRN